MIEIKSKSGKKLDELSYLLNSKRIRDRETKYVQHLRFATERLIDTDYSEELNSIVEKANDHYEQACKEDLIAIKRILSEIE